MGLNADNVLVRISDPAIALSFWHRVVPRKILASHVDQGWVQMVAAGDAWPVSAAKELSAAISGEVIWAQVYEATGDASWVRFLDGNEVHSTHSDAFPDPAAAVATALKSFGVPFRMRLFQEVLSSTSQRSHQ